MSLHDIWRGDVMPLSGVAVAIGRNSFDPPAPVVPVFDAHMRSLVMHDSGTPGSGILRYNGQTFAAGGRLELIPSNSGMQPVVTAVVYNIYDTTGGNTVTSSLTTLTLDTERVNTHPDIFVKVGSLVQINQAGVYAIEYTAGYDSTDASDRASARTHIARQAAGGSPTEVAGSRSFGYHRLTANGEDSMSAKIILDIAAGDIVGLQGIVIAGSDVTQIADSTMMTIRKLA